MTEGQNILQGIVVACPWCEEPISMDHLGIVDGTRDIAHDAYRQTIDGADLVHCDACGGLVYVGMAVEVHVGKMPAA